MTSPEILSSRGIRIRAEKHSILDFSQRFLGVLPVPRIVRCYYIEHPSTIGVGYDIIYQGIHGNSKEALRAARRELGGNTNGSKKG